MNLSRRFLVDIVAGVLLPFVILTILVIVLKTLDQVWPYFTTIGSIPAIGVSAVVGFSVMIRAVRTHKWQLGIVYFVVILPALFYAGFVIVGLIYGDAL